jgi:signal transduction histidine kinase/ligand-binding sensor domain-containing protein
MADRRRQPAVWPGTVGALLLALAAAARALGAAAVPEVGAVAEAGAAADYVLEVRDTESGLSHSSVTSLAQTPDGYLWIGTLNGGLARFDGVRFVSFHPGNTPALKSFEIQKLLVDQQGTLWIGLVEGTLLSYRNGAFQLERQDTQTPQSWLGAVLSSRADEIVLSTAGGGILRGTRDSGTNRWVALQPREADFYSSPCADGDGVIWYRTAEGRLGQIRSNQVSVLADPPGLRSAHINALVTDDRGRLWVGTDQELALWNGRTFVNGTPTNGEPVLAVRQIAAAAGGSLWVRTDEKLRKCAGRAWVAAAEPWSGRFSPARFGVRLFADSGGGVWVAHYGEGLWHVGADGHVSRIGHKEGLPNGLVECWFEDREGNAWVGLAEGGLVRMRPRIFHTLWLAEGPRSMAARSICEDSEGTMWFGTAGESFLRWRDGRFTILTPPAQRAVGLDLTVCPDGAGRLWVGSVENGLLTFEQDRFTRPFPPEQIATVARVLYTDRAGVLWIGSEFGLFRWDGERLNQMSAADGFLPACVVSVTGDRAGNLWVGTRNGELRRRQGDRFESFRPRDSQTDAAAIAAATRADPLHGLSRGALGGGERFWALHADADNVIWIGSLGGGLLRFKDGEFTRYTLGDGLPSEHVSQILEDASGQLWLGTRAGIARVDKHDLNAFVRDGQDFIPCVTYGRSDGLPTMECSGGSQPACWRGRDGRLWFATVKGAVWVDPLHLPSNPIPPPVLVEEVLADGRRLFARGATHPPPGARGTFRLRVPPGQHYFEFKFTALSFTSPDKMRFRWRLAGLEARWVEGGSRRTASYSFVPPGDYAFQVRACNNDGVWSDTTGVGLTVLPFAWQQWWFKLAAGGLMLLALVGAALLVQRRRHRARLHALERQHGLERERTRIARDIHDQVGADLTKLGKLTEFLDRQSAIPERHQPVLRSVAETTREIVRTMDEIVWAVNPRNDSLESAVNYLVHYTKEFLESADVDCELDVPLAFPPQPLSVEVRHNLFMAVKEALNNAVKHGRPTRIRLGVAAEGARLAVSVHDNGCGFSPGPEPRAGNGLHNLQKRLESIDGSFHLDTRPGEGTQVRFEIPLPKR